MCDAGGDDIEAHLDKLFRDVTDGGKSLLDHVVFTAGRSPSVKPLEEMDLEYILQVRERSNQIQRVSVYFQRKALITTPQTTKLFSSHFLVAKLSLNYLKNTPSSSLTFTGGHISEKPMQNYTIFTTCAAGLIGMVRNLALDMAPRRVNLVSAGSTITEMWGPNREQIAEVVGKISLLGKVGRPEEVAEAFTYLMKDWNATGSVVSSNGGSLLQ